MNSYYFQILSASEAKRSSVVTNAAHHILHQFICELPLNIEMMKCSLHVMNVVKRKYESDWSPDSEKVLQYLQCLTKTCKCYEYLTFHTRPHQIILRRTGHYKFNDAAVIVQGFFATGASVTAFKIEQIVLSKPIESAIEVLVIDDSWTSYMGRGDHDVRMDLLVPFGETNIDITLTSRKKIYHIDLQKLIDASATVKNDSLMYLFDFDSN